MNTINFIVDFVVKWFLGPFGNQLKELMLREVGYCSDMSVKDFRRGVYSFDSFVDFIQSSFHKFVKRNNVFIGIGFWLMSDSMEPNQNIFLYDRIVFDFDSDDVDAAVRAAVNFMDIVSNRYHIDSIVFRSGFKGAHVVIPLSKPTSWRGYQLLWDYFYSLIPGEFRGMVDLNMKQWNRLDRVPFTYNIKGGEKKLAEVIHPKIDPRGFDWNDIRALNPTAVTIRTIPQPKIIKFPKPRREEKTVVAPCMVKLLNDARNGVELPHNARLALASYMICKGFSIDEVVDVFTKQPDYKEKITRYQVEYIARKNLKPFNCEKMRQYGLCINSCGVRNPLNY